MSRRERKYAVGGTVQTYDFLWDGDDRLRQVKQGASSRFSATYNGDGLRASRTDLFSATAAYTWGPGGVLYDGATTYTPGLAQRQGTSASRFSHSDWVGSTRYLSENTGLLMPTALRFDAFGQRTALAGPTYPTPYQFAGGWGYETEYSDSTEPYLGLVYVDQRYYEAATGRFISPDPIGFDGGLNLFAYCDNDPVNAVDPSGEGLRDWINRGWDWLQHALFRGLMSMYRTRLRPDTPTLVSANSFYRPHLHRAGQEINQFIDDQGAAITNTLALGALGAIGEAGGAGEECAAEFRDPEGIRFSQDSFRPTFRDESLGTFEDLAEGLRSGRVAPGEVEPIRLVEREGHLISIDNRRLMAFRRAGMRVPTRMATGREIEEAIRRGKFSAGPLGTDTPRIRGR